MLFALFLCSSLAQAPASAPAPAPAAANPLGTYPEVVFQQLQTATPGWLAENKKPLSALARPAVAVIEVEIGPSGAVQRLALSQSSGANATDDLARFFILAAEPLPPPPAGAGGDDQVVTCLVRTELDKAALAAAVACFPPNKALAVVAGLAAPARGADPAALLFTGWANEGAGKIKEALASYDKALKAAPSWDYAARAMGLALVSDKRAGDAMPFLRVYLDQRAPRADVAFLAREVQRFDKLKQEKEEWDNRVREHLDKKDLADGVARGLAALEPCLDKARAARVLKLGNDTLVMSWKIRQDGTVHSVRLEAPREVVMSPQAECLEAAAATWLFPRFSADPEVTVKDLPIKVRGSDPEKAAPPPKAVSAELASATATVSQCMRDPQEISAYIQERLERLNECVQTERAKSPNADYPKKLPLSFVVEPDGRVGKIEVGHRFYREGIFHDCLVAALGGALAPKGGTPCPAAFDLEL